MVAVLLAKHAGIASWLAGGMEPPKENPGRMLGALARTPTAT
jgi:hypothetical protein